MMEHNNLFLQENKLFRGRTPVFAQLHICFKPKIDPRYTSFQPLSLQNFFTFACFLRAGKHPSSDPNATTEPLELTVCIPKMCLDPHSTVNKYCGIFTMEMLFRDSKKKTRSLPPTCEPTHSFIVGSVPFHSDLMGSPASSFLYLHTLQLDEREHPVRSHPPFQKSLPLLTGLLYLYDSVVCSLPTFSGWSVTFQQNTYTKLA